MLKVLFTLDYEIHGNGEGCPRELMVEPTAKLLDLLERFGAPLTIMADVAEILKFQEYKNTTGEDAFYHEAIEAQLRSAVRRGHDVQLHLHASYLNARFEHGHWAQDWSEYDFAGLPAERLRTVIGLGRDYLVGLISPVRAGYSCEVFRAANWSMSPSEEVVEALLAHGFKVDSSVFKFGTRRGIVSFDYGHAHSELVPWRARAADICTVDDEGTLWEFPIYSEQRWIGAFLSLPRIRRMVMTRRHRIPSGSRSDDAPPMWQQWRRRAGMLFHRHAWKADFNQCTGRQLVAALKRAEKNHGPSTDQVLPFVLIGHSKLFSRANAASLEPFLSFIGQNPDRFGFATFADFGVGRWSDEQRAAG